MIELILKVLSKVRGASGDLSLKLRRKDQSKQERQLSYVITKLIQRHYNAFPLPPEPLRLNVGVSISPANWWAQGINSSSRVIQIYGEHPEGPVLDWGCGSGRTLCWLQGYPGYRKHYHGCDVDKASVDWLLGQGHNVALCHDTPPLPYPDEIFAGIFCFSVLTHIPAEKHRIWYEELRRVLKPGGKMYVTTLGASKIAGIPVKDRDKFHTSGHIFLQKRGHYKSTAIVTKDYTLSAMKGLFGIEEYREEGYQDMDTYLVSKVQ